MTKQGGGESIFKRHTLAAASRSQSLYTSEQTENGHCPPHDDGTVKSESACGPGAKVVGLKYW